MRREFKAKLSAVEAELKAAANELEVKQMALSEVRGVHGLGARCGHFEYRHGHTRAIDMPSATPI